MRVGQELVDPRRIFERNIGLGYLQITGVIQ
jgi:hypothetical protein